VTHPRHADLPALIDALLAGQVELIVVGGASAILHGALAMTQDLDVVRSMAPTNVARLATVLDQLDAIVREPGQRRLRPQPAHLTSGGRLNLLTTLGPLDLLGRLHDGRGYEELLPHSEVLSDGTRRVRVVDLPTLIEIKTSAGRAKDRLVVPLLLALLREREGRGD
jgi:hypothetical protein